MTDALTIAIKAHAGQERKGFPAPFIAHPLAVAAIVMEYTGNDLGSEIVDAALLHDTIEDTDVTEEHITRLFGPHVAGIVAAVTHDPELSGRPKREKYLTSMRETLFVGAIIVSAADKLDNLRSIQHNQVVGTAAEFKNNMWFYEELIPIYRKRLPLYLGPLCHAVESTYYEVMRGYETA